MSNDHSKQFHVWKLQLLVASLQIIWFVLITINIFSGGEQVILDFGNEVSFNIPIFTLFVLAPTIIINIALTLRLYAKTHAKQSEVKFIETEVLQPWAPTEAAYWDGPDDSGK